MATHQPIARRMYGLIEPICLVTFFSDEPNETLAAIGFRNYWDGYFASRSAPLGRVPAEVVHAAFYNFADGEVARHIPRVWDVATPEAAFAAREQGCVMALRRILGDIADAPGIARAADLATKAATSAPIEGRVMYAGLRALPQPEEPVARLYHAATMLREHRGDGHIAALVTAGVGGIEAHVLFALAEGIPAEKFGRIHHLPEVQLTAVVDGMRACGLIDDSGWLSDAGRETRGARRVADRRARRAAVRRPGAERARPAHRGSRADRRGPQRDRIRVGVGDDPRDRRPRLGVGLS